jgi:two-component system, OmpR family, sensor histidine kinase KdpD
VIGAQQIDEDGKTFVRVTIDDTGPGLPAGMEARVFEKFTRGEKESAKPGIGLGLAICRAIVDAHGGTIGALNRLAANGSVEGARFWFTLPVESPPATPEALEALDEQEGEMQADESSSSTLPPAGVTVALPPAHDANPGAEASAAAPEPSTMLPTEQTLKPTHE